MRLSQSLKIIALGSLVFMLADLSAGPAKAQGAAIPATGLANGTLTELTHSYMPLDRRMVDRGMIAPMNTVGTAVLHLMRPSDKSNALALLLRQQRNPRSPYYHHWLSAAQLGAQYGPTSEDTTQITSWLKSYSLHVDHVSRSGMDIYFSGNAEAFNRAFSTNLHRYQIGSKTLISPDKTPSIPASLSAHIDRLIFLQNISPKSNIAKLETPVFKRVRGAKPNSPHSLFTVVSPNGPVYPPTYVSPQDFLTIYNVKSAWAAGITGANQTITVIGNSDVQTTDWSTFRSQFGLPAGSLTITHPGCSDPGLTSDETEAAVDTEWAGVAAPDAAIVLASCADATNGTSTNPGTLVAVENLLDSAAPPSILSFSFGSCEINGNNGSADASAFINELWQQAAVEGTSVIVSAGDVGGADCDSPGTFAPLTQALSVNYYADTPFNVAVGGTDFSDVANGSQSQYWDVSQTSTAATNYGSALSYIPEVPWNDSCASPLVYGFLGSYPDAITACNATVGGYPISGGGGGPSLTVTKPDWQNGILGNPSDGKRGIPDVSLFASDGTWGHALLVCMTDASQSGVPCDLDPNNLSYGAAGGTSFAAPAFAGIQALIDQKLNSRQGNPDYALYQIGRLEYNGTTDAAGFGSPSSCDSQNGTNSGSDCVFHDITTDNIDEPCVAGGLNCYGTGSSNIGILSTDKAVFSPAYPSTAGWDFASGLGSVNVANLVNAMATVDSYTRSAYVPGDVNGDGYSDLIFQDPTDGTTARWLMHGETFEHAIVTNSPTGGTLRAMGDANGDGSGDLFWTDTSENVIEWLSEGESGFVKTTIGSVPAGFTLVGSADFDGDGKGDLIFQNSTTEQLTIWNLNGSTVTKTSTVNLPSNSSICGLGDFDADGLADICVVYQSGVVNVLLGQPYGTFVSHTVGNVPTGSTVVGSGDFDGNGYADLLFSNPSTGVVTAWLMNGATISSTWTQNLPAGYSIADIGDLNGDGKSDVVLVNASHGLILWAADPANSQFDETPIVPSQYRNGFPSNWTIFPIQARQ